MTYTKNKAGTILIPRTAQVIEGHLIVPEPKVLNVSFEEFKRHHMPNEKNMLYRAMPQLIF